MRHAVKTRTALQPLPKLLKLRRSIYNRKLQNVVMRLTETIWHCSSHTGVDQQTIGSNSQVKMETISVLMTLSGTVKAPYTV